MSVVSKYEWNFIHNLRVLLQKLTVLNNFSILYSYNNQISENVLKKE